MKIKLVFVLSVLLLVGCGGGGGGGGGGGNNDTSDTTDNSSNNDGGDVNTGVENAGSTSEDTTDDNTTNTFNNGPIITDGSNSGSSSSDFTTQFQTRIDSGTSFDFWLCAAREEENTIQMLLSKSVDTGELIGLISVNDAEPVEVNWSATAEKLTISPLQEFADIEFANYKFSTDTRWSSEIASGSYRDIVDCGLFDQDGNAVGSTSLTEQNIINTLNSNDELNDLWVCESDTANSFLVAYLATKKMLIKVGDNEVVTLGWSIDGPNKTIFWEGSDGTIEFNGVDVKSRNSHSGFFQGEHKYQCDRNAV